MNTQAYKESAEWVRDSLQIVAAEITGPEAGILWFIGAIVGFALGVVLTTIWIKD